MRGESKLTATIKLSGNFTFTTETGASLGLEVPKKKPIEVPEAFFDLIMKETISKNTPASSTEVKEDGSILIDPGPEEVIPEPPVETQEEVQAAAQAVYDQPMPAVPATDGYIDSTLPSVY